MFKITERTLTEKIAEVSVPSRLGIKNTLGPITALMEHLGHPELKFPSVHVGGTSGKGSTATFIANILAEAGYRVGLFTKPHLSSVREQFVINGRYISGGEMLGLIERVGSCEAEKPTWFELMTALAFQYFCEQQVDLGVIEVGLGGTIRRNQYIAD
jgi:dihydrofolate synthase/folylpolyglutamate synthase